jgi:DNA-binding CsgD family transcriptional regulator
MKLAIELGRAKWGTGVGLHLYAPSRADDSRFMAWWAAYQRYSSSPGAVANSLRLHLEVDVRGDLSGLQVPALVLHRVDDLVVPVQLGRSLATNIPGAIYHELSGADHIYWLGDQWETLDAIRGFLSGTPDGTAVRVVKSRRRRPSSGWDALTSTELEVVRAVGNGYTNRQIAEQLCISPRTVQTHLSNVFVKLDATSRSQIAVEAARRLTDG